jgi:hypothetical protein
LCFESCVVNTKICFIYLIIDGVLELNPGSEERI